MAQRTQVSVSFDPVVLSMLDALAEEQRRSRGAVIEGIIVNALSITGAVIPRAARLPERELEVEYEGDHRPRNLARVPPVYRRSRVGFSNGSKRS